MSILAECSGSDRRGLGIEGLLTRDQLLGGGVTVLSLSRTLYPLLSTDSVREDKSQHD